MGIFELRQLFIKWLIIALCCKIFKNIDMKFNGKHLSQFDSVKLPFRGFKEKIKTPFFFTFPFPSIKY